MSDVDLRYPPTTPRSPGRGHIHVPVPRPTSRWRFRLLYRIITSWVAFATALAVTAPFVWAAGWEPPGVPLLILFSVAACSVVALGESLQSRAWESFRRGETQKLDRIAAEHLIALSQPASSRDLSAALVHVTPNNRPAQRIMDIIVASVGLLLCAPLLILVAALIRLDSHGPILFRQERLGLRGHPFTLLKFRTMVHGSVLQRQLLNELISSYEDQLPPRAMNDPRLTRVGGYLRRLSLDEFPSLWNVLAGHLSIVGPRPRTSSDLQSAPALAAELLSVRPGLVSPTVLAALQGRDVDPGLDLHYARHPKLQDDVALILRLCVHLARELSRVEISTV